MYIMIWMIDNFRIFFKKLDIFWTLLNCWIKIRNTTLHFAFIIVSVYLMLYFSCVFTLYFKNYFHLILKINSSYFPFKLHLFSLPAVKSPYPPSFIYLCSQPPK